MKSWAAVVLALAGCGNLTDGQPCHSNLQCSDALWCQPLCNGTAASACAPPCSDSAPCGGGAVCSASGQCQCDGAIGVDLGGADAVSSCGQSALPALISLSSTSGGAGAWVGVQASGVDAVAAANTITFGGVATPVVYQQADVDGVSSTLYVRVPSAAAAGNVVVAMATCAGAAPQSLPFTIGAQPAPTIDALSPAVAAAGTTVVVTGTGLTGVIEVHLVSTVDIPCPATVVSDGLLTFTSPGGTSGLSVQVELDGGPAGLANAYPQLLTFP